MAPSKDNKEVKIPFAKWPQDEPSIFEEKVVTVVCGNSNIHWAIHSGKTDKFTPILFWRCVLICVLF